MIINIRKDGKKTAKELKAFQNKNFFQI